MWSGLKMSTRSQITKDLNGKSLYTNSRGFPCERLRYEKRKKLLWLFEARCFLSYQGRQEGVFRDTMWSQIKRNSGVFCEIPSKNCVTIEGQIALQQNGSIIHLHPLCLHTNHLYVPKFAWIFGKCFCLYLLHKPFSCVFQRASSPCSVDTQKYWWNIW